MKLKQTLLLQSFFLFAPFLLFSQYQQLDQALPRMMQQAGVPGMSIAVIDGGRVAYSNAFGLQSNDSSVPVDDQTVFAAASLSKPLFAFAVMQLVEEGKFDLDKPLFQYLEYEDLKHDARYRKITARMVLSHTSGLPNWRQGNRLELVDNPGEKFGYSGEGFVFLQKVLERITGQSLEALMQQRALKTLGMNRSSYVWQKEFEPDFAIPHDELGITQSKYLPSEGNAAHSLQTTAPDYAKFVIALLNGIGMRKSAIDLMMTSQVKVPDNAGGPGVLSNVGWGLGWGLQDTDMGTAFWHWGDNGTYKCFVMAFPERKSGLVFFTNSSNGLSIVDELVKTVFSSSCPACRWIDYPRYDETGFGLLKNIINQGLPTAMAPFMDANGRHQRTDLISEEKMNSIGYQLMAQKKYDEAQKVFAMNVAAFPQSANVYDSYGEVCLRNGNPILARENYSKAYSLDATYKNAESIVQQLSGRSIGNTTFVLKGYSNARLVTLAGSFNGWNDISHPFRRQNGEWVCTVDLPSGKAEYKFVVDGVWIPDPANPLISADLNHNSILEVRGAVRSNTLAAPKAASSPAKDVISKCTEALGGKEKWKELKTFVMTLDEVGNSNMTTIMTMKKPNKFKLEINNNSNKMVKVFNGSKGMVSINYRTNDMGPGEQSEMAEEADFYDELLFADDHGYATELLGTEDLDGHKVFKIKMKKSQTDEQTYYIDSETYLPLMVAENSQDDNFKGVLFTTKMEDYKEVDGLKFPYKLTLLANGRRMWEKEVRSIKVNGEVEDKVFEVK